MLGYNRSTVRARVAAGFAALAVAGPAVADHSNPNSSPAAGVYDEQTTQLNSVDFTAPGSTIDAHRFGARVREAYQRNFGGVIDGTVLGDWYHYGAAHTKVFDVTWTDVGIGSPGGQATAISGTGAFGTGNRTTARVAFDPILSGGAPGEVPIEVGLTALSQGSNFGNVTVNAHLDNGTFLSATRVIGEAAGAGDTFYGFTAPAGRYFTRMSISHQSSTFTRVWFDDVGFRTGIVAPQRLQRTAAVDAAGRTTDGTNFFVLDGDTTVNTRRFGATDQTRGILEFDLSGLQAGADVTGAMLELDISQYTTGATPSAFLVEGYAGNGSADPADATAAGRVSLAQRTISDLGIMAITLDPAFIESIAGTSSHLGLLISMASDNQQASFGTGENTFARLAPTLTLDYANPVPEPAAGALLAGLAAVATLRSRRER